MERCNSCNKDQQERAQRMREKLRNLKLRESLEKAKAQEKPDLVNKNGLLTLASTIHLPHTPLASAGSYSSDSSLYHVTSPSKCENKIFSTVSTDPATDTKQEHSEVDSINESISKCHHNIMNKLFPNRCVEQNPPQLDNSSPTASLDSQKFVDSSLKRNYYEYTDPSEIYNNGSKYPTVVVQNDQTLEYKFNTKYELDYGNSGTTNCPQLPNKKLPTYNPSQLRSAHRKLIQANKNAIKLKDHLKAAPMSNDKIVCLLENGSKRKPTQTISHIEPKPKLSCQDEVFVATNEDNNTIKSILKKPRERAAKSISFSIDVQFYDAIRNGELDTVKKLIPKMDDFSKETARGKTPLHLAVESKNMSLVDYFIDKGLDVNAQDIRGQTPLHIATYNNQLTIIKFLLENGASPYIFSNFLDGFPSIVVNEYLPNALNCISVFEEYNQNLGIINNGVVYPICDWAGEKEGDLPLKEMSAIVIIERNDMLVATKWRAVDKHAKKGLIPWQIVTLFPTRNYQKQSNGIKQKNHTLETAFNTESTQNYNGNNLNE